LFIGPEIAAVLSLEGFYRHFDNRRQVAAYAGLAPSPWQSGQITHEQGISATGNPRLRTAAIELAWLDLYRKSGELCMKQEDLHAEDPFYERVSG
jgi:transposase